MIPLAQIGTDIMPRCIAVLAVALFAFTSVGCATLFSGTDDDIYFTSNPEGARIFIDGREVGTTPATISVDRPGLNTTDVRLELEGYEPRVFTLDKEFNVVSILNLGNVLFWAIDVVTGAIFKHEPQSYDIDLERGARAVNLNDLPRDAEGRYLIPASGELVVHDAETGLQIIFPE